MFRVKVPEDLRPDAILDGGGDLVAGRRQGEEAGLMVFDQSAYGLRCFLFPSLCAARDMTGDWPANERSSYAR